MGNVIKRFLSYVEIKTKITSIFAFIMAIAFLFYKGQPMNTKLTAIFFASMFMFDLTTTAINNYIDTKTNDQMLQFKRKTALYIILILFIISTALGLYLAYLTDIIVLIIGALCFICGVFYTYGPLPISRQPYGEVFSGIFYGLLIPFLVLYINMPKDTYLSLDLNLKTVNITFHIMPLTQLVLLSIAPICTTANIMLANNICDLKKDIKVKRYTLPYYLGQKRALYLFALLYYITYMAMAIMVAAKILPPLCLIYFLTILIVQKNINIFFKKQDKNTTFTTAIKNYIIIMGSISVLIFLSGLIRG